jgi:hypothetical protein
MEMKIYTDAQFYKDLDKATDRVYIASPYWHSQKLIREKRAVSVLALQSKLMQEDIAVFSPIVQGHFILKNFISCFDWIDYDLRLLPGFTKLLVYELSGWEESKGVKQEMLKAEELDIPIYTIRERDIIWNE